MMTLKKICRRKKVSIILPVYNEEKGILRALRILEKEISEYFFDYEIIVVSDGSTDDTCRRASEYAAVSPKVKVFYYCQNRGKGYALKFGFYKSSGDLVFFVDGGMEIHPKEIKNFVGLMEIYGSDAVIGSKRHPQSKINYPVLRKILSRIYQLFIRVFLDLNISDTQAGFKLFSRNFLDVVLPKVAVKQYGFDVELLAVGKRFGFEKMLEAPIEMDWEASNQNKKFFKEIFRIAKMSKNLFIDTLAVIYRMRILKYYDRPFGLKNGLETKDIASEIFETTKRFF